MLLPCLHHGHIFIYFNNTFNIIGGGWLIHDYRKTLVAPFMDPSCWLVKNLGLKNDVVDGTVPVNEMGPLLLDKMTGENKK